MVIISLVLRPRAPTGRMDRKNIIFRSEFEVGCFILNFCDRKLTLKMNSSVDTTIADVMTLSPQMPQSDRIAVPESFFKYVGPSDTVGNSLYRCLKCAKGESSKPLSCHDRSRQNLKKHIMVSDVFYTKVSITIL